ncbi:MAG: hypothetical protein HYU36_02680 [Planctomycetes bacterium]|nr:hypothetical protein [Planctomycetota bacterium]
MLPPSGNDPFDYLTALQKNDDRLRETPGNWLPWNYQDALNVFQTPKTHTLQATPPPNMA